MYKRFGIVVFGLVVGLGLVSCRNRDESANNNTTRDSTTATAPTSPGTAPTTGTGPAGTSTGTTQMSNSDLENAVKAKLQSDDQLRSAGLKVDANADKKEVTLSGTVPSQDLRTRAVDLAKSAQDGVIVNDKIDVKPAA